MIEKYLSLSLSNSDVKKLSKIVSQKIAFVDSKDKDALFKFEKLNSK